MSPFRPGDTITQLGKLYGMPQEASRKPVESTIATDPLPPQRVNPPELLWVRRGDHCQPEMALMVHHDCSKDGVNEFRRCRTVVLLSGPGDEILQTLTEADRATVIAALRQMAGEATA